jgi:hypothetical protein
MPPKLHMTVPLKFRRSANIPSIVVLHFDDLPANEVEEREGYRLTRPIRTIVDVSNQREVSGEILSKAFTEARIRYLDGVAVIPTITPTDN